jgi:hypothetical protein
MISRSKLLALFGFDRTGADLKQEIGEQVDMLISTKAIIYDGQKVQMVACE